MKKRSFKIIRARLNCALDPVSPETVKADDPLSKYVKGGPGAIGAFQLYLNGQPGFQDDGLSLGIGAVASDATVGDQLEAIVHNYHHRGWTVV